MSKYYLRFVLNDGSNRWLFEEFDTEEKLLMFINGKVSIDPEFNFNVIYGKQIEFEAREVALQYRIVK